MGNDKDDWLQPAVPPGMPVHEFIPRVRTAYKALLSGQVSQASQYFPPAVVADFTGLIRAGVDPRSMPRVGRDLAGLERRKKDCPLFNSWSDIQDMLLGGNNRDRMVAIFDADGVALDRAGDPETLGTAAGFGLDAGANWVEQEAATNAVRISRLTGRPSQLVSAQHLKVAQHGVSCTVVPVSSRNGCVVGFIDLVGPAWAVNTEMLRLVDRAAKDASIKIDQSYRERLRQLRQWAQEHLDLARYAGGALVIDTKGWVAHADRWEHDDRIAAPDGGFRLGLHEVEGLGWIVLEPLWGGWLVRRPGPGEDQPRVRVVLDLRISSKENDRAGWILVNGPTVSWRHVLSRGMAEILLMLTESGGRTYRELEKDLYSRMTAPSTVRSRWNRLRNTLDGLLASDNSHQFAKNVITLPVEYPPDRVDLLPGSTAPGVERFRRQG